MKILWIPHTAWHIPQRAHLFCRILAERHEVHVTDWVADFTRPRDFFTLRYLRNFRYRQYYDGRILVHGVPRIAPALFSRALRRWNEGSFSRLIERLIARYGIDVVIGTFVVPPPAAPRLVFDLFDDNVAYWRAYGPNPAYAEEIETIEDLYLQKAQAVVAASSVLIDKARARGVRGSLHHIANGVEVDLFASADGSKWRAKFGTGIVIGLMGNHDKPAEIEKVLAAARSLQDENITFVVAGRGSALPAAQKFVRSAGVGNIHFTGSYTRDEAPALLAAFDVGLCPYLKTPGADAGSPMRLLQYTAAGLPVVCTEIEEVRRMAFPNVILVADNAPALAEGIRQAVRLPRKPVAEIAAYDLQNLANRYEAVLAGVLS